MSTVLAVLSSLTEMVLLAVVAVVVNRKRQGRVTVHLSGCLAFSEPDPEPADGANGGKNAIGLARIHCPAKITQKGAGCAAMKMPRRNDEPQAE